MSLYNKILDIYEVGKSTGYTGDLFRQLVDLIARNIQFDDILQNASVDWKRFNFKRAEKIIREMPEEDEYESGWKQLFIKILKTGGIEDTEEKIKKIKDTSIKLSFKPFKLKEGFEEKEKITKDDITLEYFSSRNTDDNYKIVFEVSIKKDTSNLDQASLRNAIKDKLKYLDKKYMVLKEFNRKRATFRFDDDLWMEDATKDITPETIFSEFSKVFNFKVELPDMVKKDEADFQDFLIRRFKKYLYSTSKIMKWFRQFFPKVIRNAISSALPERFIYKYSYEDNSITMKLRTFWILALTYGIGEALKHRKKAQKIENTEIFFFDKVRENMSEADENVKEFFKG